MREKAVTMAALKMYEELAEWWPLLSPPEDYEDEIAFFVDALKNANVPLQGTMLDLGSGGGSNAFHFKEHFALTLVDLAPKMLDVSRAMNPESEHIVGDMRSVRLGRQFDVVFVHDAIDYMTTEVDLRQAIETAFLHCKPGGAALFVPDHMRDTFEDSSDEGGSDGVGRALRYLEWTFDPDPTDTRYTTHYVFMLREGNSVHVEHDEHECGLFSRAEWMQWLKAAGFIVQRLEDQYGRDVFVALRPS
jgi:SAM-dependent methyltransferase